MSSAPQCFAAEAQLLVGTPFRLHGRDPDTGLDCVGLVLYALRKAGIAMDEPPRYSLRNTDLSAFLALPSQYGFRTVSGAVEPGDIVLVRPGPAQAHLIIAGGNNRFIHAHATLRRVVSHCGLPDWPPLAHWRLLNT